MTWLDASEAKYLTITEGTFSSPSNGNDIARWLDKSGKDMTEFQTPVVRPRHGSQVHSIQNRQFLFRYKQQHENQGQ